MSWPAAFCKCAAGYRAGRSSVRRTDLFVSPNCRRQGIGCRLFTAVLHWALVRGADWLEWQASAAPVPFYTHLGYTGQSETRSIRSSRSRSRPTAPDNRGR
ncbi:MAG: GNAT family N-acetyltransferase [Chloroflexota bacterium]